MSEAPARPRQTGGPDPSAEPKRQWRGLGLSPKLLILTILFVMLAEVLIFVPSIANFRRNWLDDRLAAARIAVLVLEGSTREGLPEGTEARLLMGIGAKAIAARVGGARRLLSIDAMPPDVARTTDLRDASWMMSIKEAFDVLLMPAGDQPIRVIGSAMGEADFVELIIDERPLRQAMLGFSQNILLLSLFISALTAALVYLALHLMIVHPIRRLSRGIVEFEKDPENPRQIIATSDRKDEIGDAERALARMEMTLADELRAKKRLAALGLAVSKVNHDLRNMLAAAQLMSDRLTDTTDAKVQRFAPRLIATLGRAIDFCQSTLAYGRATEAPPVLKPVKLRQLVAETAELLGLQDSAVQDNSLQDSSLQDSSLQTPQTITFENSIPREATLICDPDQMARVLLNLMRNAVQALTQAGSETGKPQLSVEPRTGPGFTGFCIVDNGPGVPMRAQAHLFEAFRGSVRAGGTGLGLAIAAELVGLHGGTIALEPSTSGARFNVTLPLAGTRTA